MNPSQDLCNRAPTSVQSIIFNERDKELQAIVSEASPLAGDVEYYSGPLGEFYIPINLHLFDNQVAISCKPALNVQNSRLGAQDCKVIGQLEDNVGIELKIQTVRFNNEAAWARFQSGFEMDWSHRLEDIEKVAKMLMTELMQVGEHP